MVDPVAHSGRFLTPSDKLGKYDLIRQIAVGGMAELYLARTMGLEGFEKLVVLKRILPQYVANASFVAMFLNEARLVATLQHPNIAQVFDIDQDGADYFFSMEYVHGQDLSQVMASAGESGVPLSLDAALTLVSGLCAGLHYAHEKAGPDGVPLNVVHRDVSPSNVLVSYDGAVKLTDFGIARSGSNGTTRGGLKGKIAYMSPEQCRGKVVLDRRSDVFSAGTILYELTAGRLPFTDETEYGILNQIVNRDVEPPATFVPDYSPALSAIVMRAMARNPEQRYATALELQKALEDFAHEHRVRVSPLVVARLMSTLYPTRLEEWDHARAQGAFFVEQHVVRTLAEVARSSDPHLTEAPAPSEEGPAVGDDTSVTGSTNVDPTLVGPAPTEERTSVRLSPAAGYSVGDQTTQRPLPGMTPARASQPAMRESQPALRHSEPKVRAATPVPEAPQALAVGPEPQPFHALPRMPTPLPAPPPPAFQMPVPGVPGAVPIVPMPPMAISAGGPFASEPPSVTRQARMFPVASAVDTSQKVRAQKPHAAETVMIRVGRSKTSIVLVALGVMVAAVLATVIVITVTKTDTGTQPEKNAVAAPVIEAPKQEPVIEAPKQEETKPVEPAKQEPAVVATPETTVQPEPSKPDQPTMEASAKEPETLKPAAPAKKTTKPARPKAKTKVANKKDAAKKSNQADTDSKEQKWDLDSPFMPVRPDSK